MVTVSDREVLASKFPAGTTAADPKAGYNDGGVQMQDMPRTRTSQHVQKGAYTTAHGLLCVSWLQWVSLFCSTCGDPVSVTLTRTPRPARWNLEVMQHHFESLLLLASLTMLSIGLKGHTCGASLALLLPAVRGPAVNFC